MLTESVCQEFLPQQSTQQTVFSSPLYPNNVKTKRSSASLATQKTRCLKTLKNVETDNKKAKKVLLKPQKTGNFAQNVAKAAGIATRVIQKMK